MTYLHSDYAKIDFATDENNYEIGTNIAHLFTSEETTLLTTVDCLIKFNDDTIFQKVYGNDYFVFKRQINKITFKGESTNGTLEIWAEGEKINDPQITELQAKITNIELYHIGRVKLENDILIVYDLLNQEIGRYKLIKDVTGKIIERVPQYEQ